MPTSPVQHRQAKGSTFDPYASAYEDLHRRSIRASGESTSYFAEYKLNCLLRFRATEPILDFGCGIGNLTEQLVRRYERVHGYDPSPASLDFARVRVDRATFHEDLDDVPAALFETVVLSGVLHHVKPSERDALLLTAKEKLAPGGRIVVFEHNPFNPLTRRAVAACPFDDDAELLWPWQVRRTLARAGFVSVDLRYIVFFPKFLAVLRPLEPKLSGVLLGAQTMSTGVKHA
jgi:2-polyprenyl-3-methyl-5-hydroxy-6-metoxy-1,4-benzoquinol methylase